MTTRSTFGRRIARELLDVVREAICSVQEHRAPTLGLSHLNRLAEQLSDRRRPSKLVAQGRHTKASKKAARKEEMAKIRAAVFERAEGLCELCLQAPPTELHHVFGRVRVKQSERNCIAVCAGDHRNLTNNRPTAADCWAEVRDIFRRLDFGPEARKAEDNRLWHLAREGRAA